MPRNEMKFTPDKEKDAKMSALEKLKRFLAPSPEQAVEVHTLELTPEDKPKMEATDADKEKAKLEAEQKRDKDELKKLLGF